MPDPPDVGLGSNETAKYNAVDADGTLSLFAIQPIVLFILTQLAKPPPGTALVGRDPNPAAAGMGPSGIGTTGLPAASTGLPVESTLQKIQTNIFVIGCDQPFSKNTESLMPYLFLFLLSE